MTKLATVLAIALATVALIASTTHSRVRVERQATAAQIEPLQMMTSGHLSPTQMSDFSLVFE